NYNMWEQLDFEYYIAYCFSQDAIFKGSYSGGGVFKSTFPELMYKSFSGTIFHDQNGDGIKNQGEPPIPYTKIAIRRPLFLNQNYFTQSDQDGQFEIKSRNQTYDTITPVFISDYVESISPPYY